MKSLWTNRDAEVATRGVSTAPWQASGISIDSRSIQKGELFIALSGPAFDGHDFVAAAFEKGAAGVMITKDRHSLSRLGPCLMVADTMTGLEDLGRGGRKRSRANVIGVTGSAGKTTTKDLLSHCLSKVADVHASAKSFNNHWGVPLTMATLGVDQDFCIAEMGMNHAGELTALSTIAKPDIALITTIAEAHLQYFDSLDAIADAKSEIFNGMQPEGCAVLPRDSEFFGRLAGNAKNAGIENILSFGTQENADVSSRGLAHRNESLIWEVMTPEGPIQLDLGQSKPGMQDANSISPTFLSNSLCVIAALYSIYGIDNDLEKAVTGIASFTPVAGRGAQHDIALAGGRRIRLIDDSYNANPASMRAGIKDLKRAPTNSRRIAVMGDMKELGDKSAHFHAALANILTDAGVDLVFTCGPLMQNLQDALPSRLRGHHTQTSPELLPALLREVQDGDVLWVKGSLAMQMQTIITALIDQQAKKG